jgi:NAD(P)-dependent dehydrogenase (short-subunit alcohol dehydrogenase family)
MPFSLADLPHLSGKLALITGATGGLGYETALALAGAGARVLVTGRSSAKGADALARIRAVHPKADVSYETLDLGSLAGVEAFATAFAARHTTLDILVDNAGVMMLPNRELTPDGFERQFGTNHLAHFALVAKLMPLLIATPGARVVTVASIAHRRGRIRFDDLQWQRDYSPSPAYSQTKLANLLFAQELHRRSLANHWGIASIAAHPGISSTDLIANGIGTGIMGRLGKLAVGIFGQSPAQGALPQIFAAAMPEAQSGAYYGPNGPGEARGNVGTAAMTQEAQDQGAARRLWELSEQLTGVRFPALARAA